MPATKSDKTLFETIGRLCRTVAIAVIAGLRRGQSFEAHETRIAQLPVRDQVWITASVLAGLFACSLIAAQFGLFGIAAYFVAVILIVG